MAFRGNIRDFSTTQLLSLVNAAKKTGKLTVKGEEKTVALYFREGRLVHSATSTNDGYLTTMLLTTGKLTQEQADKVSRQTKSTSDKVIGSMLIKSRMVSRDNLIQGVKDYMLKVVYDLFAWQEGDFAFEQNVGAPKDRITVPLNLDNVILDGVRRIEEDDRLRAELPDLGAIALKITNKSVRGVKLTQDDWRVIAHIHPRNTVKQIAQNNGMDEAQIRRIVYGMLEAGLVDKIIPEGMEPKRFKTRADKLREKRQTPAQKRSVVTKLIDRIKSI